MSLKDDINQRGVKLADLAAQLNEEYGHLYNALAIEARGDTSNRKAVNARLEKVREWLAAEDAADERLAEQVRGSQDRGLYSRQVKRSVPDGYRAIVDEVTLTSGKTIGCGSVITLPGSDGSKGERYTVLRLVLREDDDQIAWVDVYGGPVFTKQLDTGQDREFASRSLSPERLKLATHLAPLEVAAT